MNITVLIIIIVIIILLCCVFSLFILKSLPNIHVRGGSGKPKRGKKDKKPKNDGNDKPKDDKRDKKDEKYEEPKLFDRMNIKHGMIARIFSRGDRRDTICDLLIDHITSLPEQPYHRVIKKEPNKNNISISRAEQILTILIKMYNEDYIRKQYKELKTYTRKIEELVNKSFNEHVVTPATKCADFKRTYYVLIHNVLVELFNIKPDDLKKVAGTQTRIDNYKGEVCKYLDEYKNSKEEFLNKVCTCYDTPDRNNQLKESLRAQIDKDILEAEFCLGNNGLLKPEAEVNIGNITTLIKGEVYKKYIVKNTTPTGWITNYRAPASELYNDLKISSKPEDNKPEGQVPSIFTEIYDINSLIDEYKSKPECLVDTDIQNIEREKIKKIIKILNYLIYMRCDINMQNCRRVIDLIRHMPSKFLNNLIKRGYCEEFTMMLVLMLPNKEKFNLEYCEEKTTTYFKLTPIKLKESDDSEEEEEIDISDDPVSIAVDKYINRISNKWSKTRYSRYDISKIKRTLLRKIPYDHLLKLLEDNSKLLFVLVLLALYLPENEFEKCIQFNNRKVDVSKFSKCVDEYLVLRHQSYTFGNMYEFVNMVNVPYNTDTKNIIKNRSKIVEFICNKRDYRTKKIGDDKPMIDYILNELKKIYPEEMNNYEGLVDVLSYIRRLLLTLRWAGVRSSDKLVKRSYVIKGDKIKPVSDDLCDYIYKFCDEQDIVVKNKLDIIIKASKNISGDNNIKNMVKNVKDSMFIDPAKSKDTELTMKKTNNIKTLTDHIKDIDNKIIKLSKSIRKCFENYFEEDDDKWTYCYSYIETTLLRDNEFNELSKKASDASSEPGFNMYFKSITDSIIKVANYICDYMDKNHKDKDKDIGKITGVIVDSIPYTKLMSEIGNQLNEKENYNKLQYLDDLIDQVVILLKKEEQ